MNPDGRVALASFKVLGVDFCFTVCTTGGNANVLRSHDAIHLFVNYIPSILYISKYVILFQDIAYGPCITLKTPLMEKKICS